MLTSLDDSLWHQLPTTFDHVGTSDPRFFDRYWFAFYAPDGSAAAQVTMGAYRNMNVLDAAAVMIVDGRQYNVRASRELGREIVPRCGPLGVEVVEPLQRFALNVDAGTHLQGQVHWTARVPPHEERPHFQRQRARVTEDYQRFDQIGVATGGLEVAGTRIDINGWWACRDHSWGVRPRMGIREPATGAPEPLEHRGYVLAFLFFSTDTLAGHVLLSGREGEARYTTGAVRAIASGREWSISSAALAVTVHAGTRRFRSATLSTQLDDGRELVFVAQANGAAIAMQGLGYSGGWDDRGGLGVWRGAEHVETDVWDVSAPARIVYPDGKSNEHWHRIQPVTVAARWGNGTTSDGYGSMTLVLSGHLPDFGLG